MAETKDSSLATTESAAPLRVLERAVPAERRNLREMLPSSGKHAKGRPQRAGMSFPVYNFHCGPNPLLCALGIAKRISYMELYES